MSDLQTIRDIDIAGKRVLVRVDFNVPLTEDQQAACDRRIHAALPTLRYALERGAKPVLISHLGRPQGRHVPELSLQPAAEALQRLLDGHLVRFIEDVGSWSTDDQHESEVVLLENLRFDPGEESNNEGLAKHLASFADVYVNDAFASCHRKHASTDALPRLFADHSRAIGLLVERELSALNDFLQQPDSPVVAVLGGAKVGDKLGAVEALLKIADYVLLGGAVAYTFLAANGGHVGASTVDAERLAWAKRLLRDYPDEIVLPIDHVIASEATLGQSEEELQVEMADGGIPPGWVGMDIGPKTIGSFTDLIYEARTIFWNGPLGKFEVESFRRGTETVGRAVAASEGKSLVGGGETGQAVEWFELHDHIDHVCTGGGALLKYVQDRSLPALDVIPQYSPVR